MDPLSLIALLNAAATVMRTVDGLIEAAEALQGQPLTDEQREAIIEGRVLAEDRWAAMAPEKE